MTMRAAATVIAASSAGCARAIGVWGRLEGAARPLQRQSADCARAIRLWGQAAKRAEGPRSVGGGRQAPFRVL